MDQTKQALITHLGTFNGDPATLNTIKGYGGQIEKIKTLTDALPALYVESKRAKPTSNERIFTFDLLLITTSDVYDKDVNLLANEVIVSDICRWFENDHWYFSGDNAKYEIDLDTIELDMFHHDNRHTITAIQIDIMKL